MIPKTPQKRRSIFFGGGRGVKGENSNISARIADMCNSRFAATRWWTCAELNCGLTRFLRGHYTLSLRLNLALKKSADDFYSGILP